MRDTVDFGIDLGTTNSALAVVTGDEVSVVRNNEGMDHTPSAVWLPRPGAARVGRAARDRAAADPANVHAEFKQEMGLNDAVRRFDRAGVALTPVQLSAEVLKSLRADVVAAGLGEAPRAAVITVPAAFQLHQNEATGEAARLAGFTGTCPLIQEPTAAAFAYGFHARDTDAYWMVFDLGGGTFDAAVVTTRDGQLQVVDHAGDPHLGGKDIDWAIVERLLVPAVVREYGLAGFARDDERWLASFARMKSAAEDAKIALSRVDRVVLYADLTDGTKPVGTLEYALTRAELERVAEPFYVRAVNRCRAALAEANLHADDVDRLLLVGGATLAPGLRAMLADPRDGLGIALDVSQDPTTVVARGAAVYAGTVPLPRSPVHPAPGELAVQLDHPRTTSLTRVAVTGKLHADGTGYEVVLANATTRPPFRSPRTAVGADGTFAVDVPLRELAVNTVTIEAYDAAGDRRRLTGDTATIRHWANEPARPVLTNTIGVAQASGALEPMVEKGRSLPATERKLFHTTSELRRSDPDGVIRIPIMEGERTRADRNLRVAVVEIRPRDVPIDLPKGSDVEVTVTIDESRRVSAVAEVPLVNEQFDAEIDLGDVPTPDADTLRYRLSEAETRLDRLRTSARRTGPGGAAEMLARIEAEEPVQTARGAVHAAVRDSAAAAAADRQLRDLMAALDEVADTLALPAVLDRVAELLADCREMVGRLGDASDRAELADLERRLATVRADGAAAAARDLESRAADLHITLLKRDGSAFDVGLFYALREMQPTLESPHRAAELVAEGEQAVAAQRWDVLRGVNQRLGRLVPEGYDLADGGIVRPNGGRP